MDGAGSAAPCLDGGGGLPYNGRAGERGGMADAPDLGSGTENVWGFKSPRSHQFHTQLTKAVLLTGPLSFFRQKCTILRGFRLLNLTAWLCKIEMYHYIICVI